MQWRGDCSFEGHSSIARQSVRVRLGTYVSRAAARAEESSGALSIATKRVTGASQLPWLPSAFLELTVVMEAMASTREKARRHEA